MDQILPSVRKEMEEYGSIRNVCLCFLGLNPDGEPSFAAVDNVSTSLHFAKVSQIARFYQASKVLLVADTWWTDVPNAQPSACPDRREAIVIDLVLPDGSLEWRLVQAYRRSGKQIAWDDPKKFDRGIQSRLPAWASLGSPAVEPM